MKRQGSLANKIKNTRQKVFVESVEGMVYGFPLCSIKQPSFDDDRIYFWSGESFKPRDIKKVSEIRVLKKKLDRMKYESD